MNNEIRNKLNRGELLLFLGAGASYDSHTANGDRVPLGAKLSELLAEAASIDVLAGDNLSDIYAAAKLREGPVVVQRLLERYYKDTTPSDELLSLARIPWPRIYTTNIDDTYLNASINSPYSQGLKWCSRYSPRLPVDSDLRQAQLIYLNGFVRKPGDGYIFSADDYADAQVRKPRWFDQLISDYVDYAFLFIGTQMNEPTFNYYLSAYARTVAREIDSFGRGYLLCPQLSDAKRDSLASKNILHFDATLGDFLKWYRSEFPTGLTIKAVHERKQPWLRNVASAALTPQDIESLTAVTAVTRDKLLQNAPDIEEGKVTDFYRGYKPTWSEVVKGVPAELKLANKLRAALESNNEDDKVFVVLGEAGSGKSTALKQVALTLSDEDIPTYFLEEPVLRFEDLVRALETLHDSSYILFIERLSMVEKSLRLLLQKELLIKGRVVAAERSSIWAMRSEELFEEFSVKEVHAERLSQDEAPQLIAKLERYGSTVGFIGMGLKEKKKLLLEKARKQLLIGLLEATYGIGYRQLIQSEYEHLEDDAKYLLCLVGLATYNNSNLTLGQVDLMLQREGIAVGTRKLVSTSARSIVSLRESGLYVRHPVYAQRVFSDVASVDLKKRALYQMMMYFADLPAPVAFHARSIGKSIVDLYKAVVNHRFISFILERNAPDILEFYRKFEKYFESDGLYVLQMGLAYRRINDNDQAMEALTKAVSLYDVEQTRHALGQQSLINAIKACENGDITRGGILFGEGKKMLEELDDTDLALGGRYYPIVALSEGCVFYCKVSQGEDAARQIAKEYWETLSNRLQQRGAIMRRSARHHRSLSAPEKRARATLKNLAAYAFDGNWKFGTNVSRLMSTDLPVATIE